MGLNKAGSSFLQSLFPHNFSSHGSSRVHYPKPHLTSGNAGAFAKAIGRLDKATAKEKLLALISQGQHDETILLSTEYMYHQFVKPAQRDLLHACFSELGIEDLTLVCVFRNIYDHAVSAYCHRCGAHAMPSFEEWIVETAPTGPDFKSGVDCYEFWTELRLLLDAARDGRFKLCYISYSKTMEQRWEELLGTPLAAPKHRAVNVSVCPSEAEVLRRLRDARSLKYGGLRSRFKEVDKSDKADDSALLNHYHALIGGQLHHHAAMIAEAEATLGFDISAPPANLASDIGHSVTLSDLQLDTLIATLAAAQRSSRDRIRDVTPPPLRLVARRIYQALRRRGRH